MDLPPATTETAAPTPPGAAGGRTPARARRRPPRPRTAAAVRVVVLVALAGLTAWNWTRSGALAEARAAEARGDFAAATRRAFDHLDRRPWSADAERVAARCLSRLDFAERAEPHYRGAGPLTVEDRLYRAYGLTRANLRDRAVAAYRAILDDRPDDVTALRLLAGVLLSQGRWQEVLDVAGQLAALPEVPADALALVTAAGHWTFQAERVESPPVIGFTLRGTVYHNMHDAEPSAEAFERVLALDPELRTMPLPKPMFWNYLAEALLRSGRSAEVVRRLEPVAESLNDPAVFDLLGRAYLQQSSFEEAGRCWRRATDLDPALLSAWQNLGRLELQRNRPEEAVRLLSKAEGLRPGSYETTYSLSLAYRRLGRDDQARTYQERADRLRRRLPPRPGGMGAPPVKPPS